MTSANSTTAPAAGGRFVVVSDQLELVGVLEEGRRLVLYLDRFADNAPLRDARIELELGAQRLQAAPDGERYVVELDAPLPPGVLPVVATVIAADVSDLLAGELTVLAPDAPGSAEESEATPWNGIAIGGGVVAAAALGWLIGRRGSRA